jgi:hypothetical protein
MKTIGKVIGYLMWIGAGILMFIFWLMVMSKWLGLLGTILAFVLAPGLVIFPIVFWIVEGVFPAFYFIVWGVGIVGMIIGGLSSSND